jgi:hypothetical protein
VIASTPNAARIAIEAIVAGSAIEAIVAGSAITGRSFAMRRNPQVHGCDQGVI